MHGEAFAAEYPGADPAATEVAANLKRADTFRDQVFAEVFRPFGLSEAAANVLAVVEGNHGPLTPSEIAQRVLVTSGTMTSVLDTLERRGLLLRLRHPEDRRSLLVDLTAAGRELVDAFLPAVHAAEAAMCHRLSPNERETLVRLLGKVQHGSLDLAEGVAEPPEVRRAVERRPTGRAPGSR